MTVSDPPADRAADRVDFLERRVRWLTTMTLVLTLAFVALVVWQIFPRFRPITSPGFVLVDGHGKKRAELSMRAEGGPMLRLNNSSGWARAAMLVREATSSRMHTLLHWRSNLVASGSRQIGTSAVSLACVGGIR